MIRSTDSLSSGSARESHRARSIGPTFSRFCDVTNTAGQGCCGALHAHSGDLEGLRSLAKRNIAAFERDGAAPIVVNSAGCGAMLKGYAHEFAHDPAWAERARTCRSEFTSRTLGMRFRRSSISGAYSRSTARSLERMPN